MEEGQNLPERDRGRDSKSGRKKDATLASNQTQTQGKIQKRSNKIKDVLSIILASFKEWFEDDKELDVPQYIIPKVLLHNCSTVEEHYERLKYVLSSVKYRHSIDGLRSVGFDYRFVPCHVHREEHEREHGNTNTTCIHTLEAQLKKHLRKSASSLNLQSASSSASSEASSTRTRINDICTECGTRLHYTETNTLITMENRQRYIADGAMYEAIVRLCQEYAQELMEHAGALHWVSVCEDEGKGNPIRVLVDCDYPIHGGTKRNRNGQDAVAATTAAASNSRIKHRSTDIDTDTPTTTKPTLLITTGKGKVRGGIFSRQHLLVSSIESSTALPMIIDAKRRNFSVAVLDPNARGEWNGMATYEQSMDVLFGTSSSPDDNIHDTSPLYILAHSASGAQLTRYLQSEDGQHLFPRIRSIAFTDSNHSIQWLNNDDHSHIYALFQSPSTVYIRSANEYRDDGWQRHQAGDVVKTDRHWHHRFGSVETVWAGTKEHSLSNWTSHDVIWSHFDKCCTDSGTGDGNGTACTELEDANVSNMGGNGRHGDKKVSASRTATDGANSNGNMNGNQKAHKVGHQNSDNDHRKGEVDDIGWRSKRKMKNNDKILKWR